MDPATIYLLSTLLSTGLGVAGGLIGGEEPNQRRPFTGSSSNGMNLDPSELLGNSLSMLYSTAGAMQDQFSKPINLRTAYAQPVAGLSGVDPAYSDRSLLRKPGLDFSGGPFSDPNSGTGSPALRQLGISNTAGTPGAKRDFGPGWMDRETEAMKKRGY